MSYSSPALATARETTIAQLDQVGLTFGKGNQQVEVLREINLTISEGDEVTP